MSNVTVYRRKDSEFLYAGFVCAKRLRRIYVKTPFKHDEPRAKSNATRWASERAVAPGARQDSSSKERFSVWVPGFLKTNYERSPQTYIRYSGSWQQWERFLHAERITLPAQMNYAVVTRFLAWREGQVKHNGKPVNRNTALQDIKIMGVILQQAIRLGYASGNCCYRTGFKRAPRREYPEIKPDELEILREGLKTEPEWMRVAFEIAHYQGCRLKETSIRLADIDEDARRVQFHAKQGKIFTTALHEALVPMIRQMRAEGREVTCTLPPMASLEFHLFKKRLGLNHLVFHSTRVTVATRLARSDVSETKAMKYMGHASTTVHRAYQRLKVSDVDEVMKALK